MLFHPNPDHKNGTMVVFTMAKEIDDTAILYFKTKYGDSTTNYYMVNDYVVNGEVGKEYKFSAGSPAAQNPPLLELFDTGYLEVIEVREKLSHSEDVFGPHMKFGSC